MYRRDASPGKAGCYLEAHPERRPRGNRDEHQRDEPIQRSTKVTWGREGKRCSMAVAWTCRGQIEHDRRPGGLTTTQVYETPHRFHQRVLSVTDALQARFPSQHVHRAGRGGLFHATVLLVILCNTTFGPNGPEDLTPSRQKQQWTECVETNSQRRAGKSNARTTFSDITD